LIAGRRASQYTPRAPTKPLSEGLRRKPHGARREGRSAGQTGLRDQVYELIRDDMRSGVLTPGQRLVEVDLAEKYGVSRTPVRERCFS